MEEAVQEAPQSIEDRIGALLDAETDPPREEEAPEAAPETEPEAEAPEDGAQAEAPQDEPEEIEIGDITDLANHLGVDPADLYNIAVPFTKDGERHEFSLGEVKDRYQDMVEAKAAKEQAETLANQYREVESKLRENLEANAQQYQSFLQAAQQTMLAEMQGVDWAKLERENPGEWARLSEQYRQKQMRLRDMEQQAQQAFQEQKKQYQSHLEGLREEQLSRERTALLRAIPEWRKDEIADTERKALVEYMRDSLGYKPEEINNVYDHRAIVLARKAMMYDEMVKKGDVAKKKVVKLAKKVVKPGQRQTAREAGQDRERAAVKAHRSNPKSMDAAALRIQQRLGG